MLNKLSDYTMIMFRKRITSHESYPKGYKRVTKSGFTLIELLAVIVIVGLLAGLGVPLTLQFINAMEFSVERKNLSESADVALRRMSREIRRLRDAKSVVTANNTTFSFIDKDDKSIQFQLSGRQLKRIYRGFSNTLAVNVSSLDFDYLNGAGEKIGEETANPPLAGSGVFTDIRTIEINLTFSADGQTIVYRTRIRPRNLTHLADLFT